MSLWMLELGTVLLGYILRILKINKIGLVVFILNCLNTVVATAELKSGPHVWKSKNTGRDHFKNARGPARSIVTALFFAPATSLFQKPM